MLGHRNSYIFCLYPFDLPLADLVNMYSRAPYYYCLLALHTFGATAAGCSVADADWSYLPPSAFDHTTTTQGTPNGCNNQQCAYSWKRVGESGDTYNVTFESPLGCLDDAWTGHSAQGKVSPNTTSDGDAVQTIELTFLVMPGYERRHQNPARKLKTVTKRGMISRDCTLIDMEDGGLYTRGVHPIDKSPHEWLRGATAWLVRAATIRFDDGTTHITPGILALVTCILQTSS